MDSNKRLSFSIASILDLPQEEERKGKVRTFDEMEAENNTGKESPAPSEASSVESFDSDDSCSKSKKARTNFSAEQVLELERQYSQQRYIPNDERSVLAKSLGLSEQQIKTWFQNRRMKEKRHLKDSEFMSPRLQPHPVMMNASPTCTTRFSPVMHNLTPSGTMHQMPMGFSPPFNRPSEGSPVSSPLTVSMFGGSPVSPPQQKPQGQGLLMISSQANAIYGRPAFTSVPPMGNMASAFIPQRPVHPFVSSY